MPTPLFAQYWHGVLLVLLLVSFAWAIFKPLNEKKLASVYFLNTHWLSAVFYLLEMMFIWQLVGAYLAICHDCGSFSFDVSLIVFTGDTLC